ncbi:MAG: class I SAM-dependent methyltransferase [Bacteroidota bacterium]
MNDIESKTQSLDLTLFEAIPSQSTPEDRLSLLTLQKAVRDRVGEYTYLEIGSHLGGTIQPYLVDSLCIKIYSIDKRPPAQRDYRGFEFAYTDNSTKRMLELLSQVSPAGVNKIECFDDDASNIDASTIATRPSVCLIDGEHTERAVLSDFRFCREVLAHEGVICFHDSNVVFTALQRIVEQLAKEGTTFNAYVLPLHVFVIEFGGMAIHKSSDILPKLINNHQAYLAGLLSNDFDREFYHHWFFRKLRRLWRSVLKR